MFLLREWEQRVGNDARLPAAVRQSGAAFLNVIARASRATSPTVTSDAMRTPPIAGPHAVLSTTTIAVTRVRIPQQDHRFRTVRVAEAGHLAHQVQIDCAHHATM